MTKSQKNSIDKLWLRINKFYFVEKKFDLNCFRQPGELNSKLASWEPSEKSTRWYRTFLNLAFESSQDKVKELLLSMQGQIGLGNPITNHGIYRDLAVEYNLDYILAAEELLFLKKDIQFEKISNIIEIGAGFGRTAHILMYSFNEIKTYTIFDLPEMLNVSRSYLKEVLSESNFRKINFTSDINSIRINEQTIGIQIDGFQEFPKSTIDLIYDKLINKCSVVYLKNPCAKYLPHHAGLEVEIAKVPLDVGRSLNVMDIWNLNEVNEAIFAHVNAYKPSDFFIVRYQCDRLFPHYIHALYKK
jgi:putative sugar O-methyltransferase